MPAPPATICASVGRLVARKSSSWVRRARAEGQRLVAQAVAVVQQQHVAPVARRGRRAARPSPARARAAPPARTDRGRSPRVPDRPGRASSASSAASRRPACSRCTSMSVLSSVQRTVSAEARGCSAGTTVRQQVGRHRRDDADAQRRRQRIAEAARGVDQIVGLDQHAPARALEQILAGGGEQHPPAVALEQADAQRRLPAPPAAR